MGNWVSQHRSNRQRLPSSRSSSPSSDPVNAQGHSRSDKDLPPVNNQTPVKMNPIDPRSPGQQERTPLPQTSSGTTNGDGPPSPDPRSPTFGICRTPLKPEDKLGKGDSGYESSQRGSSFVFDETILKPLDENGETLESAAEATEGHLPPLMSLPPCSETKDQPTEITRVERMRRSLRRLSASSGVKQRRLFRYSNFRNQDRMSAPALTSGDSDWCE